MKALHLLSIVSALLMVFGMPAPRAQADEKPAATRVPFRLLFNGHDFDPKKPNHPNVEFQLNTIDLKQPSDFLKLGDKVPNTKWKLTKFEYKTRINPQTREAEDVSELTVTNSETNQEVVLILNRMTDTAAPAPKK